MKILVVDDESDFETLIIERFRKEIAAGQYEFVFAENGIAALQKLRENDDVRIVLTDINMPEMDGLTLLSRIAPHNPLRKVIVVSAYGDMKNIRAAMNQGAVDFITKPVDFKDLKLTVEKVALQISAMLETWNKTIELTEANRALSEANRLKTELLGIAAHDLRNPLQSIMGFAELINETASQATQSGEDFKRIAYWSERISQSSQRMLRLIKDLLDAAAIESGRLRLNLATADVSKIAESAIAQNEHLAAQKQQKIERALEPECFAKVDSEKIYEAIENLITNAMKYSPQGKKIVVRSQKCERKSETAEARNGEKTDVPLPPCATILVAVQDEGQGLSEEDKQKLFGKFQRLSAQPTGGESSTGLGLSIVRQIVELHGGRVWAESDGKGKGATFFIELPSQ